MPGQFLHQPARRGHCSAPRATQNNDFQRRVHRLFTEIVAQKNAAVLRASLDASIETAFSRWHSALAKARETRQSRDIHAFRVATKRLRYRLELMRALGEKSTRSRLQYLKGLQEKLGTWHDRQTVNQVVAETLARPKFLLSAPT